MSGIVGIWEWGGDPMRHLGTLERMLSTLRHRGGFGAGIVTGGSVALGHTQGSSDTSPSQPLTLAGDGRHCTLVMDGRITNASALREALGTGNTDTPPAETVLHAYLRWGTDAFRRLQGPFALAIWDSGRRTLLLARDRMGIRPLFFREETGSFIFASEIKALLAHPRVRPILDGDGLSRLLALMPARLPGSTPLKGIGEVRPGHCLTVSGKDIHSRCWWQIPCLPHRETLMDTARHLHSLLTDAVRLAAADVSAPGCLLTGDPETAVLAALVIRSSRSPYTRAADLCISSLPADLLPGCRHRETSFSPEEVLGCLTEVMRLRDMPGMAERDAAFLLSAQAMAADTRTVLSPAGAAALLGSPGGSPVQTRSAALHAALLHPALRRIIDPEACLRESLRSLLAACPADEEDSAGEARLRRQRFLHLHLADACRTEQADRMAAGLDIRLPFCHEPLVEYLWNIPPSMLQARDCAKGLLRLAMAGDLSGEVFCPGEASARSRLSSAVSAGAGARLRALCAHEDAPLWEIFSPRAVRALCDSPGVPAGMLLQLQDWLETYRVDIRI